jgi:type I restriction enzyme S subunit
MTHRSTRNVLGLPQGCSVTFQELIDAGVLEIGDGYRAKNEEMGQGGPIFLRAGHVSDTHISFEDVEYFKPELADALKPKMAKVGDTIVTTKGNSTGRIAYATAEMPSFVYSPHLSYWRSKDHAVLPPGLLRYWASSAEFIVQLGGMKASTDMAPYLSLTDQRRLRITLPPPDQRRSIAAVLGALDDKIEVNRKTARVLEGIARAVFTSWFVDFDPVRRHPHAAASSKAPAAPTAPTLPKPLAALFPTRLVASAIGEVPEGWRVGTLGDIAAFNARTLSRADPLTGADYIDYIEISEVMRGDIGQVTRYAIGSEPSRAKRRLTHGDTVLSTVRPDRGAHFLCLNPADTLIASTGFAVMTAKEKDWAFLYVAATDPRLATELGRLADGGAYPAVRPEAIAGLSLVLPPTLALRLAFQSFASPLLERAQHGRLQSATLAALRDALLPKLISGELRIADAEKIVGRAV